MTPYLLDNTHTIVLDSRKGVMYNLSMDWKAEMVPVVERQTLETVADWYWRMWMWRTTELEAGRGTPYDYDSESRVSRSVLRAKFPWLTTRDELDLPAVIRNRRPMQDVEKWTTRVSSSLTFKGEKWRVQIRVFDFKNVHTVGAGSNLGKVSFSVSRLPITAPKSTSFSTGETVYYGESFELAARTAALYLGFEPKFPDTWRRLYAKN